MNPVAVAVLHWLAIALLGLLWMASPAAAQSACGDPDATRRALAGTHGERLAMHLDRADGETWEMWADPAGGTWTLLSVRRGVACIIAHGDGWTPEMGERL